MSEETVREDCVEERPFRAELQLEPWGGLKSRGRAALQSLP